MAGLGVGRKIVTCSVTIITKWFSLFGLRRP